MRAREDTDEEITTAIAACIARHGCKITQAQADELRQAALHIPDDWKIGPAGGDENLICMPVRRGVLIYRNNRTGYCAWGCGRVVQWRPSAPAKLPRVCPFCVAARPEKDN